MKRSKANDGSNYAKSPASLCMKKRGETLIVMTLLKLYQCSTDMIFSPEMVIIMQRQFTTKEKMEKNTPSNIFIPSIYELTL